MSNSLTNRVNVISKYIVNITKLNMFWIIYTIIGLGVFGLFPSTMALIKCVNKSNYSEYYKTSFKEFGKEYKLYFFNSNKVALINYLIAIILKINYDILIQNGRVFHFIIPIVFIIAVILILLINIWAIPIMIYYNWSIMERLRLSLYMGISKSLKTIKFIGLMVFFSLIIEIVPAIVLFFYFSLMGIFYEKFIFRTILKEELILKSNFK